VPAHDVYVDGLLSQPYSSVGKNRGEHDARGGRIVNQVVKASKRPKGFIWEHVVGLAAATHKKFVDALLTCLRSVGDREPAYHVGWRVLGTAEHGVPQHRERIYIILGYGRMLLCLGHGHGCYPSLSEVWLSLLNLGRSVLAKRKHTS
jgi:DNA (cytosine-5)-methyltransferase 1